MRIPEARSFFAARDGRFYDRWEELSSEEKQAIVLAKLEETFRFAKAKSPFHAARLAAIEWSPSRPMDGVPSMASKDVQAHIPPAGDSLLTDKAAPYVVFQSGGTTGAPKASLYSYEELETFNLANARGFYAVGLRPSDRIANLFAVGSLYMSFLHTHQMLQNYGCTYFPFSNHTTPDFLRGAMEAFSINTFAGMPSVLLNFLREMKKSGAAVRLEKFLYAGEALYDSDIRELRDDFGVTTIGSLGYGAVDAGYFAYQCDRTPQGVFHLNDDLFHLEILDEETLAPARGEDSGMIHVTSFARKLTPLLRYRVGDRGHWVETPCPCGRTTPLFKLLGRGDDVLRIGYDSIDYGALQKIAAEIPALSGTLQMEKKRADGKDCLVVRVESPAQPGEHGALATSYLQRLLAKRPGLETLVRQGNVRMPEVEVVPTGRLPLNPRTGKLVRVIDYCPPSR